MHVGGNKKYPATPLQQRMFYNSLSSPDSGVEIEQIVFSLNEKLDLDTFRHPSFIVNSSLRF